jgi:hypothetical protein
MIKINYDLSPTDLLGKIDRLWEASAPKLQSVMQTCPPEAASPVFTVRGQYTAKGWTEWTQGFQYGSAILQYDATDDPAFLEIGRNYTLNVMAPHLTHTGVHDHGFNNISTYGNLWRLMMEGRIDDDPWQRRFYELAMKCSGAVQAARWTKVHDGTGFMCSFNGPQSLFVDTIRSCRALAMGHQFGHVLMGERDEKINLLKRIIEHAYNTARYNIYYGDGRDHYDTPDVRGRTVHESIFNVNNGDYRCPSTQQGYSPFSTWTRGLSWAMCGYPEQLEFFETLDDSAFESCGGRAWVESMCREAAMATCDFFIQHSASDGIPYWDTGAPGLAQLGDWRNKPADPYNGHEPVDSSAAAIGAQGLLRLGRYLHRHGETDPAARYWQAGLTVLSTLFDQPYLSEDANHQGLILHNQYHRPNGWDHVPEGAAMPYGESSMWGDYHAREVALYVQRMANDEPYYAFFGPTN